MTARITHLLFIVIYFLLGSTIALGAEISEEAQRHFHAGVAYVDDPNGAKWEEALKEFRAAHAAHPTWKIMNNIGLCALNLERDGEAIEAYKEYLAHGGEKDFTPKQRKQMEKDIAMLTASLVRVTVTLEPAEAILIDERKNNKGELLINRYTVKGGKASLGIHPGLHRVTIEAPGFLPASWAFEAEPASTHQHDFKLVSQKSAEPLPAPAKTEPTPLGTASPEPSKPAERKTPTSVYIGLAATGVLAAAATTTGIIALGKNKDYDNAATAEEAASIKDSGKTFVLLTDIGIGAAVLSAGITTYLYFSAPKVTTEKTGSTSSRFAGSRRRDGTQQSFHVTPMASPSSAGLAFFGTF